MTFQDAIKHGFNNYTNFEARAGRAEFWYWVLFSVLVSLITAAFDILVLQSHPSGVMPLNTVTSLALVVPSWAVSFRRLHDIGKTGWYFLLIFIPIIGFLVLIYWFVQPGQPGANDFGPPQGETA